MRFSRQRAWKNQLFAGTEMGTSKKAQKKEEDSKKSLRFSPDSSRIVP
jgi:hypothetical protein